MKGRVLVVTGSRALADTFGARAAAHARVAWAMARLGPSLLIHGAAVGADELAEAAALALGVDSLAFPAATGFPVARGEVAQGALFDATEERDWTWAAGKPLSRNAAMIAFAAHLRDGLGAKVAVLALVAPWSKTGGTHDTMDRATVAGLRVRPWTCPAEFGPQEVR